MEGKAPTSLAELKTGVTLPGDKDISGDEPIVVINKPDWYDEQRFKRGQDFLLVHRNAICFALLCAIMVGFTVDQLTNALIFTGLSVTPPLARKRYIHTIDYLLKWHEGGDIFDPESVAGSAVLKVRNWHQYVRMKMSDKPHDEAEKASDEAGVPSPPHEVLPMNQYDMSLVQSGFIGPMLIAPREIGINISEKEFNDYVYFWRVVGWCLGVRDEFNMCGINATNALSISNEIQKEIVVPGLKNPSHTFVQLSDAFAIGFRWIILGLNKPALYKYLFPRFGLKPPKVHGLQWFFYFNCVIVAWINCYVPPIRWCLNILSKYGLKYIIWKYRNNQVV